MKAVLTDRYLRSIPPAPSGKRVTVWDAALPSFGARVTDKGHVSFVVMRRRAGHDKPTRIVLGSYPTTSLADARRKAADALKALAHGEHPRELERDQRRAKADQDARTFGKVAEQFIERHVRKLRTGSEVEQAIRRELIPRWGEQPISAISRRDVIAFVEEVIDRGKPYMARNLLAYLRKLFNWAMARDLGLEHSPCDRVKATELIGATKARQRVLSDDEIRAIWIATEPGTFPFHPFVRLLLILGCRRSELAKMTRDELDLRNATWRLSGDRTKNEEPRVLPLPKMAVDILAGLPSFPSQYVFAAGERYISGYSDYKERLDKHIATSSPPGIVGWRLHDLRRTMRTHLSALRIEQHVREMMIGHRQQGITGVYDVHSYQAEQRDGFEQWAIRLRSITEPGTQNVVSFRR